MKTTALLLIPLLGCTQFAIVPAAQSLEPVQPAVTASAAGTAVSLSAGAGTDYTIGPDDVLTVVFWRQKDLSADVVVRPDGKITLPLINDVVAAGLTPDQLRRTLIEQARPFVEEPTATVIVKQINSRKVFITGSVEKPGTYPLMTSMTVLQLIALAGGLKEFTNGKNIVIMRTEGGRPGGYPFNYANVSKRRNLRQNIELKSGDTVVVP